VRKRAFTLVEIMIVVLIIGILMGIAVPQWLQARTNSQQKTCITNLRAIDQAKEEFSMENGLHTGDAIDATAAWTTYEKGAYPTCPAGGTYTPGVVGTTPTCTLSAAPNNHTYLP
jgi:prepilin-type N-terminal cleavage/methylation domain-containing protein